MSNNSDFCEEMQETMREITRKHELIIKTIKECEELMRILRENKRQAISSPVQTVLEPLKTFSSKLVNQPESSTSQNKSHFTLAEKIRYPSQVLEAYEIINKFYEYKPNNTILRGPNVTKYPRFLCTKEANPNAVYKLFSYGFLGKIVVNEDMYNITKLPTIIRDSLLKLMEEYGQGTYGIQFFDASTDFVGKPIVICQLFKMKKNTTLEGDHTSLNTKIPCNIDKFQEWMSQKRAWGIITLKSRIEDMLKVNNACVIGHSRGGEVEEIITLYYNHNDMITCDPTILIEMHNRLINLAYKHDPATKEFYTSVTEQRKKQNVSKASPSSEDPF